jgi:hypothetical protein
MLEGEMYQTPLVAVKPLVYIILGIWSKRKFAIRNLKFADQGRDCGGLNARQVAGEICDAGLIAVSVESAISNLHHG